MPCMEGGGGPTRTSTPTVHPLAFVCDLASSPCLVPSPCALCPMLFSAEPLSQRREMPPAPTLVLSSVSGHPSEGPGGLPHTPSTQPPPLAPTPAGDDQLPLQRGAVPLPGGALTSGSPSHGLMFLRHSASAGTPGGSASRVPPPPTVRIPVFEFESRGQIPIPGHGYRKTCVLWPA